MAQHVMGDLKVNLDPPVTDSHTSEKAADTAEIERVMSPDDDLKKGGQNYGKMDVSHATNTPQDHQRR